MKTLLAVLLFWPMAFFGQFSDDFADRNFSSNPDWIGIANGFEIDSSFRLHLNAVDTLGSAWLATKSRVTTNTEWQFSVILGFNPSSANLARVYLVTDNPNLSDSLHGYFVQLGGTADEVSLYRQDGLAKTKIIDGLDKLLDHSQNSIDVKVTVNNKAGWELWVDTLQNQNYISQGIATDSSYSNSGYFGVYCLFTQTRANKFWFDDFWVDGEVENIRPKIVNAETSGLDTVNLVFSEPLDSLSAANLANYRLLPDSILPEKVLANGQNVTLVFSEQKNGSPVSLSLHSLADLNGNPINDTVVNLRFCQPETVEPLDVIINELLPDPTPVVGLPDVEFVELYNRSGKILNLSDIKLGNSQSRLSLSKRCFLPNEYLIVCGKGDSILLASFGSVVAIDNWVALNNSGDSVGLYNPQDSVIHLVNYNLNWHTEAVKRNGGWSLELINPDETCKEALNFSSSITVLGGTPGTANSVFSPVPDTLAPKIVASRLKHDTINIEFNESISLGSVSIWPPEIGISTTTITYTRLEIKFAANSLPEKLGAIIAGFSDCLGNAMGTDTLWFYSYQSPKPSDLVINELMIDPNPSIGLPVAEYIELFNRTDSALSLSNCQLNQVKLPENTVISAKGLLVLCDLNAVSSFPVSIPVLGCSFGGSFLTNEHKDLLLLNPTGDTISRVNYNQSWFNAGDPKANGGYSLELKNSFLPCENSKQLWQFSENELGGTPGQPNSVTPVDFEPDLEHQFTFYQKDELRFSFNMPITNAGNWEVEGSPQNSVFTGNPDVNFVLLKSQLPESGSVTVTADSVFGCFSADYRSFQFEISTPQTAAGRVVINELLYDPVGDEADFVELYNNSNSFVTLNQLSISNKFPVEATDVMHIDSLGLLLEPYEYLVLTTDCESVKKQFPQTKTTRVFEMNLPNFPNTNGNVVFCDSTLHPMAIFPYSDNLHNTQLHQTEGVSLERVEASEAATKPENWTSASANAGFATPGYLNSANATEIAADGMVLSSEVISPNSDGVNDELIINFWSKNVESSLTIEVFTADGLPLNTICKQQTIGNHAQFSWLAKSAAGSPVQSGIYILYAELFNGETVEKSYKKTVVVSR